MKYNFIFFTGIEYINTRILLLFTLIYIKAKITNYNCATNIT